MNLCIPITEDRGLQSPLSSHFGSAPFFLIVDTASGKLRTIPNHNSHHGHGMCQPLSFLAGEKVDGMVVGGIGMRALDRLQALGIQAFLAECTTVGDAVAACQAGTLKPMTADRACAHHGEGPDGPGHQR
jgi:predicted Fe-Mo cluster-binding NifX family protein